MKTNFRVQVVKSHLYIGNNYLYLLDFKIGNPRETNLYIKRNRVLYNLNKYDPNLNFIKSKKKGQVISLKNEVLEKLTKEVKDFYTFFKKLDFKILKEPNIVFLEKIKD